VCKRVFMSLRRRILHSSRCFPVHTPLKPTIPEKYTAHSFRVSLSNLYTCPGVIINQRTTCFGAARGVHMAASLRFKVGERVVANTRDGAFPGTIIHLMYRWVFRSVSLCSSHLKCNFSDCLTSRACSCPPLQRACVARR